MESAFTMEKSFLEKLQQYFVNYPGRCCDVTFLVGPHKEVVKTSRIVLEILCPAFVSLFDEKWGNAVVRDSGENGIPLPKVDPKAFRLFLKLLISEDVSVEALDKLNLALTELLNVTELCLDYKMTTIHQNLQIVISKVVFKNQFSAYSKTDEFLKLSQINIKTLLSCEELLEGETAVVGAALRWAEFQCSEQKIEKSRENLRSVLGDAIFQLRFPTMSANEFAEYTNLQDLLTEKEQLQILRFICLSDEKKAQNSKSNLQFPVTKRTSNSLSTLKVLDTFKIDPSFPSVCKGTRDWKLAIDVNKKIVLHAVGFLGPLDADSNYDVTVEISEVITQKCFGKVQRQVSAKRNKNFYVFFDSPITIEPKNVADRWSNGELDVYITMKGPNTSGVPALGTSSKDFRIEADGVGFWCRVYSSPLTEILFRKY